MSPRIQVRRGGVWIDAPGVVVQPAYAGGNGVHFESHRFDFPGISGDAIRLYGGPGGSAKFVSIGELRRSARSST